MVTRTTDGFIPDSLRARLDLARVELRQGDKGAARAELRQIAREAGKRGYKLIARTAARAR